MIKNEKISQFQLFSLIIINRFLFGFTFMPTVTITPANHDAWIADMLSGIFLCILMIPLLIITSRFPNKGFDEVFELILSKPIGKILSLIYSFYLIVISILTVLLLSDFLMSAVMPETPQYAILFFMLVPCCYATFKGLECICRASVGISILITFFMLVYFVLNFTNMDFSVFFPILAESKKAEIAFAGFNTASRFCDCFLFFMFIPNVQGVQKSTGTKLLFKIIIVFTIMNTILTIATQSVLGAGFARTLKFPYLTSIQSINLFGIIQRIEFFNVIAWIFIFFFKLSSTNLSASMIMSRVFNTKTFKVFVIPINIIIAIVVLNTNLSYYAVLKAIFKTYAPWMIFTVNFIIPSIVLIVYLFRRKSLKSIPE